MSYPQEKDKSATKVANINKSAVAAAIGDSTIADSILKNFAILVGQEQLKFPANYNLGNQLKLAYLKISENDSFRSAAPNSIGQALSHMALQALEIDKQQCYFIKYGNELKMFRSYFGDVAVAFRTGLVKDIKSEVVYKGDEFVVDIVNNERIVKSHKTKFENLDNPIIGAYAVATLPNGDLRYTIMTKKEIDASWAKSTNRNNNTVQKEFPQEMAKRTVIRRAVKMLFNTSNTEDNYISAVVRSYNSTTEEEYDNVPPTPIGKTTVTNKIGLPKDMDEVFDEAEEAMVEVQEADTEEDSGDQPGGEVKVDDEPTDLLGNKYVK